VAALAAVVLAPWIPALSRGAMPLFMDTWMYFFPLRRLAGELLRGGIAPFWNPSVFGGVPLLANPQVGVLYPGHWLFLLFPSGGMFTLTLAAHVLLAAMGMLGFLRWLGCARWTAWFGALALAWNGWTWSHFAFGSYHQPWAWWPWQWWLVLAWVRNGGRGWRKAGVGLGFLTALQVLTGAPQLVLYNGLACGLLLVAGWISGARPRMETGKHLLAGVLLTAGLAIAWSLPQLLPTRVYLGECVRSQALPVEEIRGGALSSADLVRSLFGGAGFPEDAETSAFFGSIWMGLALFGLFAGRPRRIARIIGGVALLGMLLAWRPLAGLWSIVVPGFSHMHDPRRAMALISVSVPLLGALGLRVLAGSDSEKPRRPLILWTLFFLVVIVLEFGPFTLGIRGDTMVPPEGAALPPACGWLGPFRSLSRGLFFGVFVGMLAGLFLDVLLVRGGRTDVVDYARGLGVLGTAALLVFAVNRIDLKVAPPSEVGADVESTRNRIRESFEVPQDSGSLPIRFFSFDPTGNYSYDYTRPDLGEWMLPDLAALTWDGAAESRSPGLCDIQGYDPALPRRISALMTGVNEGHVGLYPRHFALVRAPRSPLLARLGAAVAMGPVDRYALPILPARLSPGQERIVPVEEPSDFARLRILLGYGENASGKLAVAVLGAGGEVLQSFGMAYGDAGAEAGQTVRVENLKPGVGRAARGIGFRNETREERSDVAVLAFLEWETLPAELNPVDDAGSATLVSRPGLFRVTNAFPYAAVTRDVIPVPAGESPSAIVRQVKRSESAVAVEWPADESVPTGLGAKRTSATASDNPARTAENSASGTVRVVSWAPGRIELEAEVTAPGGAALVLREPYYEGWRVAVDGEWRRPMPADVAFQSVWLDPGASRVEWRYRPPGFGIGMAVAGLALLVAVVLVFSHPKGQKYFQRAPSRTRTTEVENG